MQVKWIEFLLLFRHQWQFGIWNIPMPENCYHFFLTILRIEIDPKCSWMNLLRLECVPYRTYLVNFNITLGLEHQKRVLEQPKVKNLYQFGGILITFHWVFIMLEQTITTFPNSRILEFRDISSYSCGL